MIDPTAARDAMAHLARLDDAVPGLVVGLHVIGSAMLDDYQPGHSDLDLVAEVAHPPGEAEFAAIAGAHQGDGLRVETVYVTVGGLAGAGEIEPSPWVREGEAHRDGSHDLHAVARLQLACYSATLRGDRPALPRDIEAAKSYCRGNLVSYWLPLVDTSESILATREPDTPVRPSGSAWGLPGCGTPSEAARSSARAGQASWPPSTGRTWPNRSTTSWRPEPAGRSP